MRGFGFVGMVRAHGPRVKNLGVKGLDLGLKGLD